MQLWFLIVKLDITKNEDELSAINLATSDEKYLKILTRANMIQLIVARMCLFYDKLLILERLSGGTEVASMFKNILTYSYQSHLILCWMIIEKVP
jgi:hypothetical protein